jgi:hypothetical protein
MNPSTDPLDNPEAQRRLDTALAARSIAAAPADKDDWHSDDLPLGPA